MSTTTPSAAATSAPALADSAAADTPDVRRDRRDRRDRGTARRLRRLVGAACLPGFFVVMAVGTLIDPLDDSAAEAPTIAAVHGHLAAVSALAWLELLSAALTIGGLLTLVGVVRRRGSGWANATGVLGVLTGIGVAAISMNHLVVAGLAGSTLSRTQQVEALSAFHQAGGPVVVLFLLAPVTYLVATLAAWRAELLPRTALVLWLIFAVTTVLASTPLVEWASIATGCVLTGWLARALLVADR